ncbi:hypothetical protein V5799_010388 [Amblyomma americanum]|uniref:Uncharacterized protein n=1 Tax=Amblyomma americanum TaxID=6943 RepID=A0AAQ4EKE7_AMBAM
MLNVKLLCCGGLLEEAWLQSQSSSGPLWATAELFLFAEKLVVFLLAGALTVAALLTIGLILVDIQAYLTFLYRRR